MHGAKDERRNGTRREILRDWTFFQISLLFACRSANWRRPIQNYETRQTPYPLCGACRRCDCVHRLRLLQKLLRGEGICCLRHEMLHGRRHDLRQLPEVQPQEIIRHLFHTRPVVRPGPVCFCFRYYNLPGRFFRH